MPFVADCSKSNRGKFPWVFTRFVRLSSTLKGHLFKGSWYVVNLKVDTSSRWASSIWYSSIFSTSYILNIFSWNTKNLSFTWCNCNSFNNYSVIHSNLLDILINYHTFDYDVSGNFADRNLHDYCLLKVLSSIDCFYLILSHVFLIIWLPIYIYAKKIVLVKAYSIQNC